MSAACRSVDDDVAREADSFVLASGAGVVTKRSVPPALQESLALTIEAKALLRRSRPDAEARARLCEAVVRAGATGAGDGDALTASLLKAAATFRTRLRARARLRPSEHAVVFSNGTSPSRRTPWSAFCLLVRH